MTNGTLQLAAGTTSTVGSFVTSGTTLKFLQSTTPGTQATISQASGTVTATYLSVQDSNATGGATWNATDPTNVYVTNNTGWNFGTLAALSGVAATSAVGSLIYTIPISLSGVLATASIESFSAAVGIVVPLGGVSGITHLGSIRIPSKYSRTRTVYVERHTLSKDRTAMVAQDIRKVYVEARSTTGMRTSHVSLLR
jgi:hypothetical protein